MVVVPLAGVEPSDTTRREKRVAAVRPAERKATLSWLLRFIDHTARPAVWALAWPAKPTLTIAAVAKALKIEFNL
ncbi:hypothetical protein GCM10028824_26220 [Hymenobacter segetis]